MGKEAHMIELMTEDLTDMLISDRRLAIDDAMRTVYTSAVFQKLQDIETGLYRESSAYLYDLLKDELNFGHIVQAEL